MKTLAQYLAEYIHYHDDEVHDLLENTEEIIRMGIEAYESTEGCKVEVIPVLNEEEEKRLEKENQEASNRCLGRVFEERQKKGQIEPR